MQVIFYCNQAHYKQVDKSGALHRLSSAECVLKEDTSIQEPVVIINTGSLGNIATCNYMRLPTFDRWYFVTDIVVGTGGVLELHGRVDVLYSNQSRIRGLRAQIARQEYNFNMELPDSAIPTLAGKDLHYRYFKTTPFAVNPSGANYSLTVSGSSEITN